jgi:hypothetical protein
MLAVDDAALRNMAGATYPKLCPSAPLRLIGLRDHGTWDLSPWHSFAVILWPGVVLYPEFRRRVFVETDLTEEEIVAIRERVAVLKIEHRDLDEVIARLAEDPVQDELQLKRLKRRKLLLKDHIAMLERQLVPDVRA